jgi:hypothetical protein
MISCFWCGTGADADVPPLTWASSLESGVVRYYCERCSRDNARNIECRLDVQYW